MWVQAEAGWADATARIHAVCAPSRNSLSCSAVAPPLRQPVAQVMTRYHVYLKLPRMQPQLP